MAMFLISFSSSPHFQDDSRTHLSLSRGVIFTLYRVCKIYFAPERTFYTKICMHNPHGMLKMETKLKAVCQAEGEVLPFQDIHKKG